MPGLGIATYITIADAGGGSPVCVAGGHGCQTVAESSYAHLAGISVSVLGIGRYALLLAAALARGDAARFVGLLLALAGFGFSAASSPAPACRRGRALVATKKERREEARQERLRQEAEQAAQERRRRMMQLGALAVVGALVVVGVLIAISQSGSDSGGGGSAEAADVVNEQLSGIQDLHDHRPPVH